MDSQSKNSRSTRGNSTKTSTGLDPESRKSDKRPVSSASEDSLNDFKTPPLLRAAKFITDVNTSDLDGNFSPGQVSGAVESSGNTKNLRSIASNQPGLGSRAIKSSANTKNPNFYDDSQPGTSSRATKSSVNSKTLGLNDENQPGPSVDTKKTTKRPVSPPDDSLADFKSPKLENKRPTVTLIDKPRAKPKKTKPRGKTKKESNQMSLESSFFKPATSFACPLCLKTFVDSASQLAHSKTCASKNNVSTRKLIEAAALHERQAEERRAIGLPAQPFAQPRRKSTFKKADLKAGDPDVQLALALSESLQEAQNLEEFDAAVALAAASADDLGLGPLEMTSSQRKSTLRSFGFVSSKPVIDAPDKPKRKKLNAQTVLQTRTQETRQRLLAERIAEVIVDNADMTFKVGADLGLEDPDGRIKLTSEVLKKILEPERKLWNGSARKARGEFYYVNDLGEFIKPVESLEDTCGVSEDPEILENYLGDFKDEVGNNKTVGEVEKALESSQKILERSQSVLEAAEKSMEIDSSLKHSKSWDEKNYNFLGENILGADNCLEVKSPRAKNNFIKTPDKKILDASKINPEVGENILGVDNCLEVKSPRTKNNFIKTPGKKILDASKINPEVGSPRKLNADEIFMKIPGENILDTPRKNLASRTIIRRKKIKSDTSVNSSRESKVLDNFLASSWRKMLNSSQCSDVIILLDDNNFIYGHSVVFWTRCESLYHDLSIYESNYSKNLDNYDKKIDEIIKYQINWSDVDYKSALIFLEFIYCNYIEDFNFLEDKKIFKNFNFLVKKYKYEDLINYLNEVRKNNKFEGIDKNVDNLELYIDQSIDQNVKKSISQPVNISINEQIDVSNKLVDISHEEINKSIGIKIDKSISEKNDRSNNLSFKSPVNNLKYNYTNFSFSPDIFDDMDSMNCDNLSDDNNRHIESDLKSRNTEVEEIDTVGNNFQTRSTEVEEEIVTVGNNFETESTEVEEEIVAVGNDFATRSTEVQEEIVTVGNDFKKRSTEVEEEIDTVDKEEPVKKNVDVDKEERVKNILRRSSTCPDNLNNVEKTKTIRSFSENLNETLKKTRSDLSLFIEKIKKRNAKDILDDSEDDDSFLPECKKVNPFKKVDESLSDRYRNVKIDTANINLRRGSRFWAKKKTSVDAVDKLEVKVKKSALSVFEDDIRDKVASNPDKYQGFGDVDFESDFEIEDDVDKVDRVDKNEVDVGEEDKGGSKNKPTEDLNLNLTQSYVDVDEDEDVFDVDDPNMSMYSKYKLTHKDNSIAYYRNLIKKSALTGVDKNKKSVDSEVDDSEVEDDNHHEESLVSFSQKKKSVDLEVDVDLKVNVDLEVDDDNYNQSVISFSQKKKPIDLEVGVDSEVDDENHHEKSFVSFSQKKKSVDLGVDVDSKVDVDKVDRKCPVELDDELVIEIDEIDKNPEHSILSQKSQVDIEFEDDDFEDDDYNDVDRIIEQSFNPYKPEVDFDVNEDKSFRFNNFSVYNDVVDVNSVSDDDFDLNEIDNIENQVEKLDDRTSGNEDVDEIPNTPSKIKRRRISKINQLYLSELSRYDLYDSDINSQHEENDKPEVHDLTISDDEDKGVENLDFINWSDASDHVDLSQKLPVAKTNSFERSTSKRPRSKTNDVNLSTINESSSDEEVYSIKKKKNSNLLDLLSDDVDNEAASQQPMESQGKTITSDVTNILRECGVISQTPQKKSTPNSSLASPILVSDDSSQDSPLQASPVSQPVNQIDPDLEFTRFAFEGGADIPFDNLVTSTQVDYPSSSRKLTCDSDDEKSLCKLRRSSTVSPVKRRNTRVLINKSKSTDFIYSSSQKKKSTGNYQLEEEINLDKEEICNYLKLPMDKVQLSSNVDSKEDFNLLSSPELKKKLNSYGMKNQKRHRAIKLLNYIYETMNPLVPEEIARKKNNFKSRVSDAQEEYNWRIDSLLRTDEEEMGEDKLKRRLSTDPRDDYARRKSRSPSHGRNVSQERNDDCESISSGIPEEMDLSDDEYDQKDIKNVKDIFQVLINEDDDLHRKVLMYESLPLETLHAKIKNNGVKCSVRVLMDYLNEECISFYVEAPKKWSNGRRKIKKK
ncbi:protein PFC0760c-like [Microplitis mediator]|uniref:protein PFC0760c-like n=1 Tax=Microplitis mediator TaxID=375433 RepID=UPI0025534951|nr:protein PFC0760c-like [Microplitis mediator]